MIRRRVYFAAWVVLGLAYGASVWFGVRGWLAGPRAGFSVENSDARIRVTNVSSAGPAWGLGVRNGDELTTIDGEPASPELWNETGDGAESYTFRSAAGSEIVVSTETIGDIGLIGVAMVEIAAGIFFAVSIFLLSRPYLSTEVVSFAFLGLVAAGTIAVVPGAVFTDPVALYLEAIFLVWLPVAFVGFFYVFGRRQQRTPDAPTWSRWLLTLPAIAVALSAITSVEYSYLPDIRPVSLTASVAFLVGGMAFGLGLLVRRFLTTSSQVFREQTRVIVLGTAIAVAPVVIFSVIPSAFGSEALIPPQFSVLTAALIPLTFSYAILRHELMGIRRLVHRGVSYVLISLVVILVYFALIAAMRGLGASTAGNSNLDLSVLIAILVGVPLVPQVRGLATAAVDRLLYRDFVNHREVIREVSIDAVHTTELKRLGDGILGRVRRALALEFVVFYEGAPDGLSITAIAGNPPDGLALGLGMAWPQLPADAATTEVDLGGEAGRALCASTSGPRGQPGILVLGPKHTGEPFRSDDVQLAQTVASLVSSVVARLRLLDELRAQSEELAKLNVRLVEVEEQELAKLSGYLHDEPLQKVTYVLGQYREKYSEDELTKVLLDVTDDLRLVSSSLSPAILVDLGLVRALEYLLREAENRNRFRVDYQVSGVGREERLPPGVELTAYRVAQEALANCQKHSKASAVWVELAVSPDTLVLSIDDNGVGLNGNSGPVDRGPTHLGLRHLKQRVQSYGGTLEIKNRQSRGTSVVASIPILRYASNDGPEFRIHAN